ncbi:sensor histidine kinase [Paenibacillus marinisediminis]
MNKTTHSLFTATYIVFGCLLGTVSALFALYMWLMIQRQGDVTMMPVWLYIIAVAVLVIALILVLKMKIARVVDQLDDMMEHALRYKQVDVSYDETSLSALENKLCRVLEISRASSSAIEVEKNSIKSLISDISHQTKTPIANIVLYAQLLQEHDCLDESAAQLVDEIAAQSDKLSFLIQALVHMSRLETGIVNAQVKRTALYDVIAQAVATYASEAESKQLALRFDCDRDIIAQLDPKWTAEAIGNIVHNAVKYTPNGGNVEVTVEQYELFTRINVADNGMGIEEGEINKLFQRFYRSRQAAHMEGVGLGLYLAREIITAQGGYIKVSSRVGQGSVFSVFLPN